MNDTGPVVWSPVRRQLERERKLTAVVSAARSVVRRHHHNGARLSDPIRALKDALEALDATPKDTP